MNFNWSVTCEICKYPPCSSLVQWGRLLLRVMSSFVVHGNHFSFRLSRTQMIFCPVRHRNPTNCLQSVPAVRAQLRKWRRDLEKAQVILQQKVLKCWIVAVSRIHPHWCTACLLMQWHLGSVLGWSRGKQIFILALHPVSLSASLSETCFRGTVSICTSPQMDFLSFQVLDKTFKRFQTTHIYLLTSRLPFPASLTNACMQEMCSERKWPHWPRTLIFFSFTYHGPHVHSFYQSCFIEQKTTSSNLLYLRILCFVYTHTCISVYWKTPFNAEQISHIWP